MYTYGKIALNELVRYACSASEYQRPRPSHDASEFNDKLVTTQLQEVCQQLVQLQRPLFS